MGTSTYPGIKEQLFEDKGDNLKRRKGTLLLAPMSTGDVMRTDENESLYNKVTQKGDEKERTSSSLIDDKAGRTDTQTVACLTVLVLAVADYS